jgi:hypothetical protein
VRSVGTQTDVAFDDPLIHRVIHDMGGWLSLGSKTEDEWPFVAKEFENRYRGFKARNERVEYPKLLTGLYNAYNKTKGFALQPVTMIGNPEKVKQVMLAGSDKPQLQISHFHAAANEVLSIADSKDAASA